DRNASRAFACLGWRPFMKLEREVSSPSIRSVSSVDSKSRVAAKPALEGITQRSRVFARPTDDDFKYCRTNASTVSANAGLLAVSGMVPLRSLAEMKTCDSE